MEMIEIKGLVKIFNSGGNKVTALDNVDLSIQKGDFALIKGPSGCGKSTLLFTIGGLLKPSAGAVRISGLDMYSLSEKERLQYRSRIFGFVFQSYYLMPYLTVLENIMIVNNVSEIKITEGEVHQMTDGFNLNHRLNHKPSELSVGEKQRVCLVRALAIKPEIILADEPTGNLDPENANDVLVHLDAFRNQGGTVVMVSHGTDADKYATRQIKVGNGGVINDKQ